MKIFIIILSLGTIVRYKLNNEKARVTFSPILVAGEHLIGWKPLVISRTKGTRWNNIIKVEKRKFKKDNQEFELERRVFPHCVLYSNQTAWMTQFIFEWELDRLSRFLREKYPRRKYLLLLDNAPPHQSSKCYDNLDIHFFPAQTTGYLQLGSIYRFQMISKI